MKTSTDKSMLMMKMVVVVVVVFHLMVVDFLPYHWLFVDVIVDFSLYLHDDISLVDWKTTPNSIHETSLQINRIDLTCIRPSARLILCPSFSRACTSG